MSQNRYYWGVVLPTLAEWSGHESEELHQYMKDWHLPLVDRKLPSGELMRIYPSTASLSVEEFSAFVDKVVRWAAEQGVRVPDASEVTDA